MKREPTEPRSFCNAYVLHGSRCSRRSRLAPRHSRVRARPDRARHHRRGRRPRTPRCRGRRGDAGSPLPRVLALDHRVDRRRDSGRGMRAHRRVRDQRDLRPRVGPRGAQRPAPAARDARDGDPVRRVPRVARRLTPRARRAHVRSRDGRHGPLAQPHSSLPLGLTAQRSRTAGLPKIC